MKEEAYYRCYAEISLAAIRRNVDAARARLAPGVRLMAVVKADAYGHGACAVAACLEDRADCFAVASLEEGTELREAGIVRPILILGYTSPVQYRDMIRYEICPTIFRMSDARKLSETASELGKTVQVHIALDTGMGRIGYPVTEEAAEEILSISRLEGVEVEGMFTHFSCADQEDKSFCHLQLGRFDRMVSMLSDRGLTIPLLHVCNSAAIMEFEGHRYNMVRAGITNYGIYPSTEVRRENMELEPALQWKSRVIHVKEVAAGTPVSYGATWVSKKDGTRIATISVGYADGYPRALSSRGRVLIRGRYAPIIGRVCMDQMMVDVTDIEGVEAEDVVTLVGSDGENRITIEEVADPAGRFNYEMLCNISQRVTRIYRS